MDIDGRLSEEIISARNWFVERMDNCFIAAGKDLHYLDANETAKKLFPKLRELEPEDHLPEEVKVLFTNDDEVVDIGGRSFRKKREERWGDESYSCICLSDRSAEEELMRDLKEARAEADDTNVTRSVFLSNMSHEIRTPMNAIVGMSDILMREDLPAHTRGYINNIKGSVGTLLSIINDVLDISKIEDGSLKILEEEYEPMSVLDDLAMIFLNRIGNKPVELLYMIDPDLPAKLYGDSRRIQQIIINMFNNAVEYTDSGYILLSFSVEEKEDDYCLLSISISDTGQGIREENRGDLFSPLHNAGSKQKNEKEGLGLGLSICKQLVKLMGGEIGVESTYGSGSRFYFTISQGVVSGNVAAELHDRERKRAVYHLFENHYLEEALIRMANRYGIKTAKYEGKAPEGDEDKFLFTDSVRKLSTAELNKLRESRTEVCVLHNPMMESLVGSGCRAVNKPLYSLNFTQIMNDDLTERDGIYEMEFTVPGGKVLFVDDNEMNLQVAKGLLAPLKMQIDTAANGKEGVEKIMSNDYDMVFMDHMMPVMDGVEALERIRQARGGRYAELPVIALSANATAEAEAMFREKGFTDFIAKPIKLRELSRSLREWLPAGKIREAGVVAKEEPVEEKEITIPDEIEGLDVQNGIEYCGGPALFLKCMVIFYKIIDKNTTKIRKFLEDGLIRDYTIEVHALKNSARMIGAQKLSDDFKELEQMGNAEDIEGITEKTPAVLELYQSYKSILKPFADNEKQNSYTPTQDEVKENLRKIIDAMDAFDMDGADEAMGVLREYALPKGMDDKILELDALVSDFAMEDVIRLAEELINECETYFEEGND
ncbi:MAG: response regulator [Lachnospiraceae bacterium]|nr:response regulator [Lachnospiraceae bacterium]